MDTQNREPESQVTKKQEKPDHVDHLMQLNEVRPAKQNQGQSGAQNMVDTNQGEKQQLQLPPPDQNVTNLSIYQATPTLLTDVETAAELSPSLNTRKRTGQANQNDASGAQNQNQNQNQSQKAMAGGRGLAMAGLIASLISLFVLPIFMGLVGIVLGFIGMRSGNRTLSFWAIGIGAVSILVAVLFTPFVVR